MAQIREIKSRIKSVKNTAKVTHAMELISAVKMRKAQEAAVSSRPYNSALIAMLSKLSEKTTIKHPLLEKYTEGSHLIILVSTDRGLVGGLNLNLLKEAVNKIKSLDGDKKFIVVGKKALPYATKSISDIEASFVFDEYTPYELSRIINKLIIDLYSEGELQSVHIVYQDFVSTIKQAPNTIQVLPITMPEETQGEHADTLLFEPNTQSIIDTILPHYVLTMIYQVLLEAKASEHSARMITMKNATDAAKDLASDLTLTYNQARQEAVTNELLDSITAQSNKS
jgi:F-type H+-transporting ATPase subunit gamma